VRRRQIRTFLGITVTALLVFVAAQALWGLYANYNRYNPVMDYVPQEMGFYDTTYWELKENDCRNCHGDNTADRHHATDAALLSGGCALCHFDEAGPTPSGEGVVVRDCTTSGCHSWDDVPVNGWHHDTGDNCIACHDQNLIADITPFRDLETDPPQALDPDLIPNPFSCDNCHWEQPHSATGDPDHPGHPSTYDHYDGQGQFIGFHEYSKPLYGSFDTHHMAFKGSVSADCATCHSKDPNRASWDPYDKELIRYCEICHTMESLHGIGTHEDGTTGWQAVGFHVSNSNNPTDAEPVVYRTWGATGPYLPETAPGFTANEMCFGCHETTMMPERPEAPLSGPVLDITTAGIQPNHGACGAVVNLRGEFFGDEHAAGHRVQMKLRDADVWHDMPVYLWTDTLIRFEVPCWTLAPGNYRVAVMTPTGKSNRVNFTLTGWHRVAAVSPDAGACDEWITLSGIGFGDRRSEVFADGYNGVHRVVDFVSCEGTYTALGYKDWSDTSIKTGPYRVFKDRTDAHTGHRNYVQDDGSGGCAEEPTMMGCDQLSLDTYRLYVRAIYFGDEDGSGGLSCGDTIFQVVVSDPVSFELIEHPTDEVASAVSSRLQLKRSGGDGCCFISTALEPTLRPLFSP
jgi:hypothetical protein